jgi:peptide deformylase
MAIRRILELGDPRLWRRAEAVADPASPEVRALLRDLDDTLADFRARSGFGRGIAAPQIGVGLRVIRLVVPGGFAGDLLDPRIAPVGDERFQLWDDCFSLPGLLVRVERWRRVRVDYSDETGAPRSLVAEDDLAELVQHEADHLDGILATDRAISPRALTTRAEWERAGRPR